MKERLEDLAQQSYSQNRGIDSDFLTLDEFSDYIKNKNDLAYADPEVYCEDWERKLIHFGPGRAEISLLKISSKSAKFVKLAHPDYLGALLGLGLERRVVGDIVAYPDHAYVYVKSSVANFIIEELSEVGRARVFVEELEDLPEEAQTKIVEENLTVSSLRPDKIIASAFRISRSKAVTVISQGLVFVNGMQIKNSNHPLSPGDILSFRHHGKIRFVSEIKRTKKGSYLIEIGRYQ